MPDFSAFILRLEKQCCQKAEKDGGGDAGGCGASVLCGYLLRQLREKKINSLLFCATGALMSPVSTWQGESIPAICHAISISNERR